MREASDFQTPQEMAEYYPGLLIKQYLSKLKAYATIKAQTTPMLMLQPSLIIVSFSAVPASGHFDLYYGDSLVGTIQYDDSSLEIQTLIRSNPDYDLSEVFITGLFAARYFNFQFLGVTPPALYMRVSNNTLLDISGDPIEVEFTENDEQLPIAVQNAFNILPVSSTITNPGKSATGAQLDILGKYVGAYRTGPGFTTNITLDNSDFFSLISMAILLNCSGSSLYDIQNLISSFFQGSILVFDYQNMQMSYLISESVGSFELVQRFIVGGYLPKPMGVQLASIIYVPSVTTLFGFRTYELEAYNATPFNSYSDYRLDWPWLSYANAISY